MWIPHKICIKHRENWIRSQNLNDPDYQTNKICILKRLILYRISYMKCIYICKYLSWNVYQILCVVWGDNNNVSRFFSMYFDDTLYDVYVQSSYEWGWVHEVKKSVEIFTCNYISRRKKDAKKTHDYHNLDHHLRTIIAHLWNYSRFNDFECYIYLNFSESCFMIFVFGVMRILIRNTWDIPFWNCNNFFVVFN